jgi:hypothetical protein
VVLYPQPDWPGRLIFAFDSSKPARFPQLRNTAPLRYSWMRAPSREMLETIPDFVVLFDDRGANNKLPLFARTGPDAVECCADILTSALWTLARLEESVPGPADVHGRFPAKESAAFRADCLDRPIVDEYALAFREALLCLLAGWTPEEAQFRLKLSHDIDLVGLPRSFRSTAGHIYPRRLPRAFRDDVLSGFGIGAPAYLAAVVQTARISVKEKCDSAFYWKASPRTAWDSGYDPQNPQVRAVIENLMREGFEVGVHPAYGTFQAPEVLAEEVARLRVILGPGPVGGRQHFLRWRPSTWAAWERVGLAYDSSVGFADAMGFRAGTAIPYHPWLLEEDRESALLEIPLLVMDCTPVEYMRLGHTETLARITALVRRCANVGGVFTLLWHNTSVIERPYASLYHRILSLFPSRASYCWKDDLACWPFPRVIEGSTAEAGLQ